MNEYDLSFGSTVNCTDGKCGRLRAVAVNRDTLDVTHLIVEEGFLLKKARVFPFSLVSQVAGSIALSIDSSAAGDFPAFREEIIESAAAGGGIAATGYMEGAPYHVSSTPAKVRQKVRHGVPDERAVLERGVPVITPDARAGKLEHLLVDGDSGRISGLVLQQGVLVTSQRVLPAAMITTLSESGIYADSTPEQLDALASYEQIAAQHADEPAVGPPPNIVLEEGPVTAEGPGYRVARALDQDPRTADAPIEVIFERGVITLSGLVDSPQTRAAAEAIASAQPGVITVVNSLKLDL